MAVAWALGLQRGNAGDAFAQAFQQGQQTNQQNTARAAMAALVTDPNNQRALQALASVDPQAAQQFQQQRHQQTMDALAQHRDNIIKGAEIFRQINPKDQASYSQALQLAQQAGIDISEVPQQYDPQYVAGVTQIANTFAPPHNPQLVPFQPGGGVAAYDPQTQGVRLLVTPNDGSHAVGAPAGNIPQVHDQSSYDAVPPGSQYMGPDGHIRVKGGQTGSAPSGGF